MFNTCSDDFIHSYIKCTMPSTNINSDWMSNASSGLCIIYIIYVILRGSFKVTGSSLLITFSPGRIQLQQYITLYLNSTKTGTGRLEEFLPRRLTVFDIRLDLVAWSVKNHLGFGEKCVSLASPGTQQRSCFEPPSSKLSITHKC